jgi:3-oxoacyl-[acyl-carrier protein] reductase
MTLLSHQTVLITGAGTGLGKELAHLFVKEGARIIVCGRRADKIQHLKKELQANADQILAISADMSQPKDVKALVNQAVSRFGRIDVVINNAAVFENTSIAETGLDSWNYQFQNNTTSTFLVSRECIPVMRKQKSGQIINITSGLAETGASGFAAYSATKAAVEAFTFSLEEEETKNGIYAYVINPGVMKTNMQTLGAHPKDVAEKFVKFVKDRPKPTGKVVPIFA